MDFNLKHKTVIIFRTFNSLDVIDFPNHLLINCEQVLVTNCTHLTEVTSVWDNASSYVNQKAPLIYKEITVKETGGVWYNTDLRGTLKIVS